MIVQRWYLKLQGGKTVTTVEHKGTPRYKTATARHEPFFTLPFVPTPGINWGHVENVFNRRCGVAGVIVKINTNKGIIVFKSKRAFHKADLGTIIHIVDTVFNNVNGVERRVERKRAKADKATRLAARRQPYARIS